MNVYYLELLVVVVAVVVVAVVVVAIFQLLFYFPSLCIKIGMGLKSSRYSQEKDDH